MAKEAFGYMVGKGSNLGSRSGALVTFEISAARLQAAFGGRPKYIL